MRQLTVTNRTLHPTVTFEEYLSIAAVSNSYLKSNINGVVPEFIGSEKVELGSMVDAILTDANASKTIDRNHKLYKQARDIAAFITAKFGVILAKCNKQVAITATIHYNEWSLEMKTLIDFVIPTKATIELKVTATKLCHIEALIEFMGYENQVYIEKTLAGLPDAFLLIYSTKDKDAVLLKRTCNGCEEWLIDKILEHGSVKETTII